MPLNVPNDYAVAAFEHTITGFTRSLVCTIGIDATSAGAWTTTDSNDLFTAWAGNLDTSVSPSLTFQGVTVYFKQPLGYIPVPSSSAAVVGTSSGTSLPPNTAVMVEKNTLRPGRSGRGRLFLPGLSEAFVDPNGNITSGAMTQLTTDLAAARLAMLTIGAVDRVVLFHDTANIDPSPTNIETLTPDPRVSSIAKRFRRSA